MRLILAYCLATQVLIAVLFRNRSNPKSEQARPAAGRHPTLPVTCLYLLLALSLVAGVALGG